MKKITFLFTFLILSAVSTINAQTTFGWDTPIPTTDPAAGTVTQIKDGITTTLFGFADAATPANAAAFADGGGFYAGTSGNIVASGTASSSVTITFSEPVNITSIIGLEAIFANKDWTFTPTGGSNSPVVASLFQLQATPVNLNWTAITEFTVTSSIGNDVFSFDNLIVTPTSTVFDWDTPAPTVNLPLGTVTQVKNGITTTFYGVPNEAGFADSEGFGGSIVNTVFSSLTGVTFPPNVTFTFSEPVNITSILGLELTTFAKDWTFTPTGGSNSPVVVNLPSLTGVVVNLNWTAVTEFTVTTNSTLGGDVFAFDNLVVLSNSALSVNDNFTEVVKVYPNPVNDVLYLKNIRNLKSTKIYNNLGQLVLESKEDKIDFSNISKGLYFLQISSDNGVEIKRVIKK